MTIFAPDKYEYVARLFDDSMQFSRGSYKVGRYKNGELNIHVTTQVSGRLCLIIGSIAPSDENLFEMLLLAHTLKKEGATRVHALFPYLAYTRHDKTVPSLDLATQCVGRLLQNVGIGRIMTLDLHSERSRLLMPIPITSVSLAELWTDIIHEEGYDDATIIAPDNGAIIRCEAVAQLQPTQRPIAHFEKHRGESSIEMDALHGFASARAVIIDDILDTGETLVLACERLNKQGTSDILILVTHGLFSGEAWLKLFNLGVSKIICTDSVSAAGKMPYQARIKIVSAGNLIRSHIDEL